MRSSRFDVSLGGYQEINGLLKQNEDISVDNISSKLSPWAAALFDFLPIFIKKQVSVVLYFGATYNSTQWMYSRLIRSVKGIAYLLLASVMLQLLLDRESDGSVQLSQVRLVSHMFTTVWLVSRSIREAILPRILQFRWHLIGNLCQSTDSDTEQFVVADWDRKTVGSIGG
jgi:hypothetical protein